MLRIKRLYLYILETFVPVFFMTFAICLFIVLMQFVWKYVEDLVGKGLEIHVFAELFLYAALTLVPMALPLAILLASLMSFGNLGERYELLAIKAAGVSLLKAMRPLIVLIIFISIGAFFFQNDVLPRINVKMRTLLISVKQKSPELEIPESTFYSDIPNYNLYVTSKDRETGTMKDVIIYDTSKGFDNMEVTISDSAKMSTSSHKDYILLKLYNGHRFSNFQQPGGRVGGRKGDYTPYNRATFKEQEVIIPFDGNFNRMDESSMDGTQIAKNISELRSSIDSLSSIVDSMNIKDRTFMLDHTYLGYRNVNYTVSDTATVVRNSVVEYKTDLDSTINTFSRSDKMSLYQGALSRAENNKNDFMFRSIQKIDIQKKVRYHDVELQRKFTLSFACLVFFFIGAPLGAIIRKGGLGMPVVVSVILFIIYYIIDNLGYKMARDGVWEVWQGVWLSSFILFPLGGFLTYKAMNDSDLFNPEAYGKYLKKILLIKVSQKATNEQKLDTLESIAASNEAVMQPETIQGLELMDSDMLRNIADNHKVLGYDYSMRIAALNVLRNRGADLTNMLDWLDKNYMQGNLTLFKKSGFLAIGAYILMLLSMVLNIAVLSTILQIIYIVLFIRSIIYYFTFYGKVDKKTKFSNLIISILLLVAYPIVYVFANLRMKKYLRKL